jgi:26S proteasome regulatory subunit N2
LINNNKKDDKSTAAKEEGKEAGKEGEEKKKEKEPDFEMIQNPTRVIKPQLKVISLPKNSRYVPLKEINSGGIIMLRDTQSDLPEVIVETVKGK